MKVWLNCVQVIASVDQLWNGQNRLVRKSRRIAREDLRLRYGLQIDVEGAVGVERRIGRTPQVVDIEVGGHRAVLVVAAECLFVDAQHPDVDGVVVLRGGPLAASSMTRRVELHVAIAVLVTGRHTGTDLLSARIVEVHLHVEVVVARILVAEELHLQAVADGESALILPAAVPDNETVLECVVASATSAYQSRSSSGSRARRPGCSSPLARYFSRIPP